ncbi:MAG: hypothetical protein ACRD0G_05755 [Acidimicrobiales bacterium]
MIVAFSHRRGFRRGQELGPEVKPSPAPAGPYAAEGPEAKAGASPEVRPSRRSRPYAPEGSDTAPCAERRPEPTKGHGMMVA